MLRYRIILLGRFSPILGFNQDRIEHQCRRTVTERSLIEVRKLEG